MATPTGHIVGLRTAMTPEVFTLTAIRQLRKETITVKGKEVENGCKGIWGARDGHNDLFRAEFPSLDLIEHLEGMKENGLIATVPRKGGPIIYVKGEEPEYSSEEARAKRADKALELMVAAKK